MHSREVRVGGRGIVLPTVHLWLLRDNFWRHFVHRLRRSLLRFGDGVDLMHSLRGGLVLDGRGLLVHRLLPGLLPVEHWRHRMHRVRGGHVRGHVRFHHVLPVPGGLLRGRLVQRPMHRVLSRKVQPSHRGRLLHLVFGGLFYVHEWPLGVRPVHRGHVLRRYGRKLHDLHRRAVLVEWGLVLCVMPHRQVFFGRSVSVYSVRRRPVRGHRCGAIVHQMHRRQVQRVERGELHRVRCWQRGPGRRVLGVHELPAGELRAFHGDAVVPALPRRLLQRLRGHELLQDVHFGALFSRRERNMPRLPHGPHLDDGLGGLQRAMPVGLHHRRHRVRFLPRRQVLRAR